MYQFARRRRHIAVGLASMLVGSLALTGCTNFTSEDANSSASPATCDPLKSANPGTTDQTITIGGKTRTYVQSIPSSYDGRNPLPIVMTFHGRGSSARAQLALTGLEQQSNKEGYVLVAPNAVAGEWALPNTPGQATADTRFVSAILDKLSSSYCVNRQRTYASGLSLGSAMTFVLACVPNRQFAAFGGVGASFYRSSCDRSAPAPIIYFHGTADPIVPFAGGKVNSTGSPITREVQPAAQNMAAWAKHNKCSPDSADKQIGEVTEFRWTGCSQDADVDFYKVAGGGHTWPGTDPTVAGFTESFLGKTTQDVNANELMWQFFSRYELAAAPS
ncbi:MAG: alpha/beta hydrolase family esterase [Candidatus Nanopelagicales bacterium]